MVFVIPITDESVVEFLIYAAIMVAGISALHFRDELMGSVGVYRLRN